MDTKQVLKQLIKIADNQQKIINKLAQQLPGGGDVILGDQKDAPPATPPMPTHLPQPTLATHEAKTILAALPGAVKVLLAGNQVEVHDDKVMVFAKPNQSDKTLDAIQRAVQNTVGQLAQKNMLTHTRYVVSVQG